MSRLCTGCSILFPKMHLLLNHRRSFRCGGEWNEAVFIPTHKYVDDGVCCDMIYTSRIGAKFSPDKPRLNDPTVYYTDAERIAHTIRKAIRKAHKRHKARTPGTVRTSRMPGGSSFRNNWENNSGVE